VSEVTSEPATDASLQPIVDSLAPIVDSLQSVNGSLDSLSPADVPPDSPLATLVASLDSLSTTLGSLVTTLAPIAHAGVPVTDAIEPIVTALHPLIDAVNQALQPLIIAMKPLMDAVTEPLTSALNPLVDALRPLVGSLAPLVGGLAPIMAALQAPASGDVWEGNLNSAAPAGPAGPESAGRSREGVSAAAANGAAALPVSSTDETSPGAQGPNTAYAADHALPGAPVAKRTGGKSGAHASTPPGFPREGPRPVPSLAGKSAPVSVVTFCLGGLALLLLGLAWTRQQWVRRIHGVPATWRPAPFLSLLEQPG